MARVDQEPEDRDQAPLRLEAIFDCPECDTSFDWVFVAGQGVFDTEDLIEAPEEMVQCPGCGYEWQECWPGWVSHGDAG